MGLKSDLENAVGGIFRDPWEEQTARQIPDLEALKLYSNHAKYFDRATVLYADIDESTDLVRAHDWRFAAETYKAYLRCAARIISDEGGTITAYDGDRVMGIFVGSSQTVPAARAAFKINWAVINIIRPASNRIYNNGYNLKHRIGIDSSGLRAARIGVRDQSDLVWVGRAANYAAKLCPFNPGPIWVTKSAFGYMDNSVKHESGNPGQPSVWHRNGTFLGDEECYYSYATWSLAD